MNNLQTPLTAEQKANLENLGNIKRFFNSFNRLQALCAPHIPPLR